MTDLHHHTTRPDVAVSPATLARWRQVLEDEHSPAPDTALGTTVSLAFAAVTGYLTGVAGVLVARLATEGVVSLLGLAPVDAASSVPTSTFHAIGLLGAVVAVVRSRGRRDEAPLVTPTPRPTVRPTAPSTGTGPSNVGGRDRSRPRTTSRRQRPHDGWLR